MKEIVFFIFYLMLFGSCQENKEDLKEKFRLFSEKADNKTYEQLFRDSNIDTFLLDSEKIANFYNKTERAYEDTFTINSIKRIFQYKDIDVFTDKGNLTFLVLYHNYLNGREESLSKTKFRVSKILKQKAEITKKEDIELENKLTEIVKKYLKYNEKDVISLIFPLDLSGGLNHMNAYLNPIPATLDYSHADDTLKVDGIILEKEEINSGYDIELVIRIKSKNFENAKIYDQFYNIGDTLRLSIREFGRPPIN